MARQRPVPRLFDVTKTERLTPNMHRLTLGGDGLDGFPSNRRGGYIKFRLPDPHSERSVVRTYTIRNASDHGIVVDFALHGTEDSSGPATDWALNAKVGDTVLVGGPGPAKPLPDGHGPFLLVGDMTALPDLSVNLEALPDDAQGHAIILIRDKADIQPLDKPNRVDVQWIIETDLGANPALLAIAARKIPAVDALSYAWIACEFEAMKLMRQFLRVEHGFDKERLYISSYWKRGMVEDEHKKAKREDAQAKP
jgi:NADPH-dependent ferric siderophore reductase